MQGSGLTSAAFVAAFSALALGCNDVGTCDDPLNGRAPVKVGPELMYAGQAIINASCAGGTCHSSGAKGATRQGAPEGLDFDLLPKPPGMVIEGADGGVRAVQLNNQDVAALRQRQRVVFDNRELIWEQIEKGLMPPKASFKSLANLFGFHFESDQSCTADAGLGDLDSAKSELRNWLACGTPIVETSSSELPFIYVAPDSDAGAPEKEVRTIAYAGAVGYQLPSCGNAPAGDGGAGPTFDDVYNNVLLRGANGCVGCHNSTPIGGVDLTTSADIAYRNLLGANGMGAEAVVCDDNSGLYVKPGDPAASFFYIKLGGGTPSCGTLMPPPPSPPISATDLQLVRDWIMAGAPR